MSKKLTPFQQRNKQFKKASRNEKRILVAKDIIAQVLAEKFNANEGSWVSDTCINTNSCGESTSAIEYNATPNDQVCDITDKHNFSCSVCALGSVLLSLVRFKNHLKLKDMDTKMNYGDVVGGRTRDVTGINKIFTKPQQALIEIAFECGGGHFMIADNADAMRACFGLTSKQIIAALDFYYDCTDSNKRLIAIMQNIIDNNGVFMP